MTLLNWINGHTPSKPLTKLTHWKRGFPTKWSARSRTHFLSTRLWKLVKSKKWVKTLSLIWSSPSYPKSKFQPPSTLARFGTSCQTCAIKQEGTPYSRQTCSSRKASHLSLRPLRWHMTNATMIWPRSPNRWLPSNLRIFPSVGTTSTQTNFSHSTEQARTSAESRDQLTQTLRQPHQDIVSAQKMLLILLL